MIRPVPFLAVLLVLVGVGYAEAPVPIRRTDFEGFVESLPAAIDRVPLWRRYERWIQSIIEAQNNLDAAIQKAAVERRKYLEKQAPGTDPWMKDGLDFGVFAAEREFKQRVLDSMAEFESDVTRELPEPEQSTWLSALARFRRARVLPELKRRGHVYATFDLIALMKSLEITGPESRSTASILDDYAVAIDSALIAWEQMRNDVDALRIAGATSASDRHRGGHELAIQKARADKAVQRELALVQSLQTLNMSFVEQLEALMPASSRLELRQLIDQDAFPSVLVASPVPTVLSMLLECGILSEPTRESLRSIGYEFQVQDAAIRERLVDALQQAVSAEYREAVERLTVQFADQHRDINAAAEALAQHDPRVEPLLERRALTVATMERLRATLKPGELQAIPPVLAFALSITRPADSE